MNVQVKQNSAKKKITQYITRIADLYDCALCTRNSYRPLYL